MTTSLQQSINNLRSKKPLILCLSNYITIDFMSDALLALRATPLITESLAEMDEFIELSDALYINIGTLNLEFMKLALLAASKANHKNIPVILDPIGAGQSFIRTSAAKELLHLANIIRGSASEILALGSISGAHETSTHITQDAVEIAHLLATNYNKVIAISGASDYITNGINHQNVCYGHSVMKAISGMDGALSAGIAAFAAANTNPFEAVVDATSYFGLCSKIVAQSTQKPGSFKSLFLDSLYEPDWTEISNNPR